MHNCNIIHDLHSIPRWAESFCGIRDPPLAQTSTNYLWYLQTRLICAFSCVYEQRYSSGILQSACVNKPFPALWERTQHAAAIFTTSAIQIVAFGRGERHLCNCERNLPRSHRRTTTCVSPPCAVRGLKLKQSHLGCEMNRVWGNSKYQTDLLFE